MLSNEAKQICAYELSYFFFKNYPMKIDASLKLSAITIMVIMTTVAGTHNCDKSDAERVPQKRPAVVTRLCRPGIANELEFLKNSLINGNDYELLDAIHEDQKAKRGEAQNAGSDVVYDSKEWLEDADDNLQKASDELKKPDAELNAGRAMQAIDEAWLSIIEAMQISCGKREITDGIVGSAGVMVQRANELTADIAERALNRAGDALKNAQDAQCDVAKRLQSALEAVENAEVAGNAEVDGNIENYMREASKIMQKSIEAMARIVIENAKKQPSNSHEVRGLNKAMRALRREIRKLDLDQCIFFQLFNPLLQSTEALRQCAAKMGSGACVLGVSLSRIIDAVRKTTYGMLRSMKLPVSTCDVNMKVLILRFNKTLYEAWDTIEPKDEEARCAQLLAGETVANDACDLSAAAKSSRIAAARRIADDLKKSIVLMKKECNAANRKFNEMVSTIIKERRAKAAREKNTISGNFVFDLSEQNIEHDLYVLQKCVVNRRSRIMSMMEHAYYFAGQKAARMERRISEAEQKAAAGKQ